MSVQSFSVKMKSRPSAFQQSIGGNVEAVTSQAGRNIHKNFIQPGRQSTCALLYYHPPTGDPPNY